VRVDVLYFAAAREAAGPASETIDLEAGATVAALLAHVVRLHPPLAPLERALAVAVDERFATRDVVLRDGAVVALLPPASGG